MPSVSNKSAVIFDLYQTIADIEIDEDSIEFWLFLENYLAQYGSSLSGEGLKQLYLELCRQIEMDTPRNQSVLDKLFPRYFRIITNQEPDLGQLYTFIALFRRRSRKGLHLRKYVLPLLDKLDKKGYAYGLMTNTEAIFTKIDLEDLKIANRFRTVVLTSDVGSEKPRPEPFLEALKSLDVRPENAIYIGDDFESDIIGADGVGMKSILMHDNPEEYNSRLFESCLGIIPSNGKGLYKKIASAKLNLPNLF